MLTQGLRDAQVQRAPFVQAHGLVDHVARDAVFEAQRAGAFAGEHEVVQREAAHQRVVRGATAHALEQPRGNDVADDRRGAHQLGLRRRDACHARLDQRAQPARALLDAPEALRAAAVRRRVAKLFDVERVAAGVAADLRGNERVDAGQQLRDLLGRRGVFERRQRHDRGAAHARVASAEAAGGEQHEHRQPQRGDGVEQLVRGVVGPLPIVDEEQHGLLRGKPREERADGRNHGLGRSPARGRCGVGGAQ